MSSSTHDGPSRRRAVLNDAHRRVERALAATDAADDWADAADAVIAVTPQGRVAAGSDGAVPCIHEPVASGSGGLRGQVVARNVAALRR